MQVALAMKLGAKAVIIANNGSTGFFRMTQTGYDGAITIPSASMPQNSARYLWNALAAGSSLYVSFLPYTLPAGESRHACPCRLQKLTEPGHRQLQANYFTMAGGMCLR